MRDVLALLLGRTAILPWGLALPELFAAGGEEKSPAELPERQAEHPEVWLPIKREKNALFAQDSLLGRSPAWKTLLVLPLPGVLSSPGVLESPGEAGVVTSGESPRRWHGPRAGRWRELQQSCACLFALHWFLTLFYTNSGCLVPIQVPAGQEQWEGRNGAGCGHRSEVILVGSARGAGLVLLGTAVPVSGLAPPAQPGLHLSCSPGCFSSPRDGSAQIE